jgi:serine/threonine protein kinase
MTELHASNGHVECVTEALASRFASGVASASEREQVMSHLESGCKTCEQLLNRVAGTDDGEPWGKAWCFTAFRKGQLLDNRYRIVRYIDRGGMGEVYEAFDCLVGMRVAIKTVSSTLSDDLEASALIKTEVQHALRVNHRNVCRIYSLGLHTAAGARPILFITMELVDGITLGSRIEASGKLSPAEAVRLSGEILSGMAAAHDAGVLHRDLKSDNIMLRPSRSGPPSPVLMDFGLAVALPSDASHISGDKPMVGSLPYMPPEQVQGGSLRIESDLYSFGVVLFEMLTGRVPFHSEQAGGLLKRLFEEAPRVRVTAPDVPESLEEIVARCLEKDPKRRYASARAVLNALRATQLWDDTISTDSPRDSVPPAMPEVSEPAVAPSPRVVEPTLTAATPGAPIPSFNAQAPRSSSHSELRIPTPVALVLEATSARPTARPMPVKQRLISGALVAAVVVVG